MFIYSIRLIIWDSFNDASMTVILHLFKALNKSWKKIARDLWLWAHVAHLFLLGLIACEWLYFEFNRVIVLSLIDTRLSTPEFLTVQLSKYKYKAIIQSKLIILSYRSNIYLHQHKYIYVSLRVCTLKV